MYKRSTETQSRVPCSNCGREGFVSEMEFDDEAIHYVCDRQCFDEWHSDNVEQVGDYYYRMNVDGNY